MGRKIAIVEDEEAIRENYAVAFRRQGYDVLTYEDRSGALEAFEDRLPDLAIVDVGLGDEVEGGFDLCRQLRSISTTEVLIELLHDIVSVEIEGVITPSRPTSG